MNTITYIRLTKENFSINSLDEFVRHQEVKECWRKVDNKLVLLPNEFVEEWNLQKCREVAGLIKNVVDSGGFAYGAFSEGKCIGYILVSNKFFGSSNQYIELLMYHVSEPYRNRGIGKKLFKMARSTSKEIGAKSLYISAHSSKESQAAYRKLGCIDAVEINQEIADNEPFDIQMEYILQ